ncbi:prepilin-type N-terminal cleavage/methylation domain-containing protein [Achromobacter xylosoxidans]
MRPVRPSATVHRRQQEGFSLIETIIAVLVATILVTLAAGLVKRETDDAAARGTENTCCNCARPSSTCSSSTKPGCAVNPSPMSPPLPRPSLPGPPSVAAFKPLTVAWMISRH